MLCSGEVLVLVLLAYWRRDSLLVQGALLLSLACRVSSLYMEGQFT